MTPTLLVADDSTTVRRVVDLIFAAHGIAVVGVSDGQQAVDYLSSARPDVALISASLSKFDGFEVAHFIRSQARLHGLPVLLVAGAFDVLDDERARAAGAAGVLYKPLEPEHVINRVKELMDMARAGDAPPAAPPPEISSPSPPPTDTADSTFALDEDWFTDGGHGLPPAAPIASKEEGVAATVGSRGQSSEDASVAANPPAGASFGPAEAFAVLLAAEQGEAAPPVAPQPIVELSDSMVERIADRVAERLMQGVFGDTLRHTVHSVSERLVREEIQRIRAAAHAQGRQ